MTKEKEISVSITRIVSASYCEQKVILDRRYRQKKTAEVARKAAEGEREHLRFEREGRVLAARGPILPDSTQAPASPPLSAPAADKRCFVATTVYGEDAKETKALRAWRDRVLNASFLGRSVVRLYYLVSPCVARWLTGRPRMQRAVRRLIDAVLTRIER